MATAPQSRRLNLTRDQLAAFLTDQQQIRQFELLFSTVDQIQVIIGTDFEYQADTAAANANNALAQISALAQDTSVDDAVLNAKVQQALDAIPGLAQALELLALSPRQELGTIASQNSDNVNITGGLISGLDAPLPVASGGTGVTTTSANQIFAGPTAGAAAPPSFRALVAADIPSLTYISSIGVTAPITSTGGLTPTIGITQSGTASNGYLSSTDWNTFNGKAPATSGTSILYGNGTGGFSNVTIGSGVSFAGGILSATGTGGTVTSVTGTSPVVSSGGTTPAISLATGYGDTQNPYASKTANYVLAAPNGSAGAPTFRALVAADIPALPYGTGTVTSVSVVSANGFAGTVATSTTTPAITMSTSISGLLYGNGTALAATTVSAPLAYSAGTLSITQAGAASNGYLSSTDWNTFNNKGSGTVTSVSGTTGRITSTGGTTPVIDLASGIATPGTTGSSTLIPVITVDTYGRVTTITTAANPQGTVTSVATGTGLTGGTITSSGTISFAVAAVGTWAATPSSANLAAAMTDETGSGSLVFATRPSFASTIGVGAATASASGAGVSFPATQSASTDANTLDDYEEGTYTPNLTNNGTITYTAQYGRYTKIGRQVHIWWYINVNTVSGGGGVATMSAPFASDVAAVGAFNYVGTNGVNTTGQTDCNSPAFYSSSTTIYNYNIGGGIMFGVNVTAGSTLVGSMTYFTS
jgi:hypothetical protein